MEQEGIVLSFSFLSTLKQGDYNPYYLSFKILILLGLLFIEKPNLKFYLQFIGYVIQFKEFWRKTMKTIGNILWFLLGGVFWALAEFLAGIIACVTIIGIPLGLQLFKVAGFVLWPFGKKVTPVKPSGLKMVLNILWAITGGWISALGFLLTGVIFCITIIGIPFGRQYFKMAHFVLLPLGNDFVK